MEKKDMNSLDALKKLGKATLALTTAVTGLSAVKAVTEQPVNVYATEQIVDATKFADFNETKWWADTFKWAIENGVVNGYKVTTKDGVVTYQLRPDTAINEAEYLAIMLRMFDSGSLDNIRKQREATGLIYNTDVPNAMWYEDYYVVAYEKRLIVKGDPRNESGRKVATSPIKRGDAARLIVGALSGKYVTEEEAINFLYEKGLSKGAVEGKQTIESFQAGRTMTRAEALQFIKNIKDANYTTIQKVEEPPADPNKQGDGWLPNGAYVDGDTSTLKGTEQPYIDKGWMLLLGDKENPSFMILDGDGLPKFSYTTPATKNMRHDAGFGTISVSDLDYIVETLAVLPDMPLSKEELKKAVYSVYQKEYSTYYKDNIEMGGSQEDGVGIHWDQK